MTEPLQENDKPPLDGGGMRDVSSLLKTPEKLETFTMEQRQTKKREQAQALEDKMEQFQIQIVSIKP